MIMVYVDNPKGHICRFRRCDLMEVPDTVEKFDSVLTILASVLNAKVRFILSFSVSLYKINIFVNVSL